MKYDYPQFETLEQKQAWLVENQHKVIAHKKAAIKHADGLLYIVPTTKAAKAQSADSDALKAKLVINTTKILDSHEDVHIDGIWNKSLKEYKLPMLLREHKLGFEYVIADGDDVKAYAMQTTFKDIGFDLDGPTEALVFEANITKENNAYMFDLYRRGKVRQHSVGMQYVKIYVAVNSDKYEAEYANWQKYYPMVANKKAAEELGYFFAVTEAKVIEGSAVPLGSNPATPTLDIKTLEPLQSTHKGEPPQGTRTGKALFIPLFNC